MEISIPLALSALTAGGLTFLAPCTLPLVPAYLGFISGVDVDADTQAKLSTQQRSQIITNGLAFVIGFSVIFILFGLLAGLLGQTLSQWQDLLTRTGGIFIIGFGLMMLFDVRLLVFTDTGLNIPEWIKPGSPISSFGVGATFAVGWTPCVGPILGSILLLASQQTTMLSGGLLLAIYSVGLATPFLLLAIFYARISSWITGSKKWLKTVSRIGGLFLVAIGILLLTNNFSLTIEYGYKWLDFFEYRSLQQYL